MSHGSELMPHEFRPGMILRATVILGDELEAGEPALSSDDLVVLAKAE